MFSNCIEPKYNCYVYKKNIDISVTLHVPRLLDQSSISEIGGMSGYRPVQTRTREGLAVTPRNSCRKTS